MIRADMIATVGREYLVSNIENDEHSYPKAYRAAALPITPIQNSSGRTYESSPQKKIGQIGHLWKTT